MIHVVQPRFDDEANSLWFLEGSANYLSMAIPFESGLISREDYLQQINAEANRYYGNSRRNIPNSSIPDEMWKSPDSSTVAYNRGAIYFADLDARVRSKSHGKATVITLMKELQEMSNQNKPHGLVQWREIVERHAGKEGAEALDAMLAGRTIFPVAGTFGQCLEAKKTEIGIFDLQYSKAPGENQIVSVTPGSNAERAGLKVGDALAGNTLMKPYFSEVGRALPLPIKRNGQRMTISYVPRSGSTEARTWQASSDKLCSDKME
nr:hypothetical protein [Xanthomonas euvesicatoria]